MVQTQCQYGGMSLTVQKQGRDSDRRCKLVIGSASAVPALWDAIDDASGWSVLGNVLNNASAVPVQGDGQMM
jgi:hypothetical protein